MPSPNTNNSMKKAVSRSAAFSKLAARNLFNEPTWYQCTFLEMKIYNLLQFSTVCDWPV